MKLFLFLSALLIAVNAEAESQYRVYPGTYQPKPYEEPVPYRKNYDELKEYVTADDNDKKLYYCDPRIPPKCANGSDIYCLRDYEYPLEEIRYALESDPLILKKYAEIPIQSADNLIDGLSSDQEIEFDYSSYRGELYDGGHWIGGEGYICPSDVIYARPVRARNVDGEWRVVVQNVNYFYQTQRVEHCFFAGASCRTLAPCYKSQCVQKHAYHRILSFDPCDPERGLFIDIYKFPSACSCHIPSKMYY